MALQLAWYPPRRFNPRAREGRDVVILLKGGDDLSVSIHAPARGATFRNTTGENIS